MTPERRQQIGALFNLAVEQPSSDREAFLRRTCEGDSSLYEEVRRMLLQRQPTSVLDPPPAAQIAVSAARPVFQEGQIVAGRYQVLRYLNRGGMGEVYEALDLELSETVALKTLLPAIAHNESMILRFKREIALCRKIAHPNVCKVFDLERHESQGDRSVLFLTMEFLDGETLEARLRRGGALKEAEALPLLRQMVAALDASRASGVIHRDLKPSNVMLVSAKEGLRAVVTDFGLARGFVEPDGGTTTMSLAVVGTLDYMAPERLTGSSATFASDVYSLGMTVYKMVTGRLPFAGDTPMAAAILRSHRPVPSPRNLAPSLDDKWERAILRALDADPAKRFVRAGDFLAVLLGEDVAPGNLALRSLKWPFVTRRRIAITTGALAIAGLTAVWWERGLAGRRLPPEAQARYQQGVADNAAGAWFAATKALDEAAKLAPRAPQVHARLAESWVGLEMPENAAEEMLIVRREDSSGLPRADRLQIEAIDLSITRDFAAAAAKYEEMARAGIDVAVDLGRAYENAGRPDDAIRSYRRAAEGPGHSPAAWLRLGVLYARQSNTAKSSEAFAEADRLYQLTSNLEGLTEVSLQQGIAANTRGQLDVAAVFLRKALNTARLAGNLQQEINATLRLSTNAYLSGASADADAYARTALDTARSHHLDAMAIRGLVNLGSAFRRKQDFAHSAQYYREALDLARQTRSDHLTALSLFSLAALHDQTGQSEEAVREAQEALTFYQANHYAKESLQCLTVIARGKRNSGDYGGALVSFRSLLQLAERSQDRAQLALAHEGIGSMLFMLERYPEALEEYRKSLDLATDAEHIGYESQSCANTLWRLGRYEEAMAMFARADAAAQKFEPLRLELMGSRAAMLLSQNRFGEAHALASRALASDLTGAADLQSQLQEVLGLALLGMGNKSDGVRGCEKARAAAEASHDKDDALQAGVALLQARIEQGDRKAALQVFQEIEPSLASHPELSWRALALASRADPQYNSQAREALLKLSHLWGDSVYTTYLTRPDVGRLSLPLLHPVSALH